MVETFHSLGSIPNRYAFLDAITKQVEADPNVSLMLVDVVRFSDVSTGFGYRVGDEILHAIANRIQMLFSSRATLGRISGDIFGLVFPKRLSQPQLQAHYHHLVEHFKAPIPVRNHAFIADFNVGAVANVPSNNSAHLLFTHAESALKQAKQSKFENFSCSNIKSNPGTGRSLALKADLKRALDNNELELYFQPCVNLKTLEVTGAECLLRWNHPLDGLMFPGALIEAAESYNMMNELGYWVLNTAMSHYKLFRSFGLDLELAVNISPTQLYDVNFAARVHRLQQHHDVDLTKFQLELTEDVVLSDSLSVRNQLDSLRALGARIAVDDFGKGYSNLTFIRDFNLDCLKIDKSFVMELGNNPVNKAMIQACKLIAGALDCKVVAEGIEDISHLHMLRDIGVTSGQGFLFSKAVPAHDFIAFAQSDISVGSSLAFRSRIG